MQKGKHAMHSILKIVSAAFILLSFVNTSANSADSSAAQKAILLRYSIMDEATRNSDTRSFASVLADNYEEIDSGNRMLNRNEAIESFNAFLGQQKRQFKTKIISAKISNTSAKVICQRIDVEEGLLGKELICGS